MKQDNINNILLCMHMKTDCPDMDVDIYIYIFEVAIYPQLTTTCGNSIWVAWSMHAV